MECLTFPLNLVGGIKYQIRKADLMLTEMVGMTGNLVHLGGGDEEGTLIKLAEEETITGENQTPTS